MKHFTPLNDLPVYDLYSELNKLIVNGSINWPEEHSQICLNTVNENSDNYALGSGSLLYDWQNSREEIDHYGNKKTVLPRFEKPYSEDDFKFLCNQFKGTMFEDVYNTLSAKYKLGRVRIMKSSSKTCLTWHVDLTPRIHYPIKTQEGCFMIIEDEVKHMHENTWWMTNTVLYHSAFNGSKEDRIHLVAVVL
jgi:hypothetical protein